MKIKTGIIGYGVVGKKRKKYIDENKNLELCAISDIIFKKESYVKKGVSYFQNYHDIFEQDLDAIFICMPNYLAKDITIEAIKRNIHIFCEKPPAKNLKELLEIKKNYIKYPNLKLKYGFNHRYHDSVLNALKIIQSKEYGKVVNIRGVYGKSEIVNISKGWRSKREYAGGGILLDQGIHMLDMINIFVDNDIIDVKSMISNSFWKLDVEDNAFALLRTKAGQIISIHSSATQWEHKFLIEVTLQKGLLILSGILSGSKSYGKEKLELIPRIGNNGEKLKNTYSFSQNDLSWKKEIDEFADCIKNDKKIIHGNLEDSIKVMKLIETIYSKDKRWYNSYVK